MTYLGTVQDGVVVFKGEQKPPEGTDVRVFVQAPDAPLTAEEEVILKRQREALLRLADRCEQHLPPDASLNVDHYLYGMPKK